MNTSINEAVKLEKWDNLWDQKRALSAALSSIIELRANLQTLNQTGIRQPGADAVSGVLEKISKNLGEVDHEIEERIARQKRYARTISIRHDEVRPQIAILKGKLKNGEAEVKKKREALADADVPEEEILRLFPDFNDAETTQAIAEIEEEFTAWSKFQKSGMAKDLPADANHHRERIGRDYLDWSLPENRITVTTFMDKDSARFHEIKMAREAKERETKKEPTSAESS